MEESSMFRAITIAVGVFVAIATITAVLTYYNTAKDMVQAVGSGTDYDTVYSDYVEEILVRADANINITGTEVINLINYFYKNEEIQINIKKMKKLYDKDDIEADLLTLEENLYNINNDIDVYNEYYSQIVPTQKFKINKRQEYGKLVIELEGK